MNDYILNKICEFISLTKSELKTKINIGYEYDKKGDIFNLWHDYVKFDEQNFKKIIGKYIRLCFFENDIFNVSLSYRHEKAMEMNKIYNTLQHLDAQPHYLTLSYGNLSNNKEYNIKNDSELQNIDQSFKMNLPKQQCVLSEKINTNIENSEVLAA